MLFPFIGFAQNSTVYITNEGNFGTGNGSLTMYDNSSKKPISSFLYIKKICRKLKIINIYKYIYNAYQSKKTRRCYNRPV